MGGFEYDGRSVLVSDMEAEAREMETFPVLFGDEVAHFHEIHGGHNRERGISVVNFIHRVQGVGSPYQVNTDELPHTIEAHLDDNFYYLSANGILQVGDYPDENHVISVTVESHMKGEYSFSEPMTEDIDKRETRYE